MIVSRKYHLVYVCPPKTGSNSLSKILLGQPYEGRLWDERYAHHNTLWVPDLAEYFYFISVRNPYERMFSFWKFALHHAATKGTQPYGHKVWRRYFPRPVKHPVSFEQFVLNGPQSRKQWVRKKWNRLIRTVWSCGWHVKQLQKPIDAVVRLETLASDLQQIPFLHDIVVPHTNIGPKKQRPWQAFYTPELVQAVQALWPDDFEQFGYSRDLPTT